MKSRSYRSEPAASAATAADDWVDGSWTVDCSCGVTFDDGEEMVSCDECGVWVHTRCARFVKGQPSFACHNCKSAFASIADDTEETEVAQLLAELPTKTCPTSFPTFRRWAEVPLQERVHVHGPPGGDPALFQDNLSSVFTPNLWICSGFVPKKFGFRYREFPCWDTGKDGESNENQGADVLFALSKETNRTVSFPQSGVRKIFKMSDSVDRSVVSTAKKEINRLRPLSTQPSKKKKDESLEGKESSKGKSKVNREIKKTVIVTGSVPSTSTNKTETQEEGEVYKESNIRVDHSSKVELTQESTLRKISIEETVKTEKSDEPKSVKTEVSSKTDITLPINQDGNTVESIEEGFTEALNGLEQLKGEIKKENSKPTTTISTTMKLREADQDSTGEEETKLPPSPSGENLQGHAGNLTPEKQAEPESVPELPCSKDKQETEGGSANLESAEITEPSKSGKSIQFFTRHKDLKGQIKGSTNLGQKNSNLSKVSPCTVLKNRLPEPKDIERTEQHVSEAISKSDATASLSDEQLALLLHQQLNSSPRVPRVPRVRPAATAVLAKRSSGSAARDHVPKKKSKEDVTRERERSRDLCTEALSSRPSNESGSGINSNNSPDVPSDCTGRNPRTLPGLMDEILSKNKSITYEELCDTVFQQWSKLRKPNGERYAYPSHIHAVNDCLRNRREWAHLLDHPPKANSNKKRRNLDSESDKEREREEELKEKSTESNSNQEQDEFTKGKRKTRKRRRLELRGRSVREARRKQSEGSASDGGPQDNPSSSGTTGGDGSSSSDGDRSDFEQSEPNRIQ